MLTRSRLIFVMLIAPFCSQALAGGTVEITPALGPNSKYVYCAYPYCNPGHGSIQGTLDDGTTIELLRQEADDGFSLVLSGFTSDPGSGYLVAVNAWCDAPYWFMDLRPTYSYYSNGSLYVDLFAGAGYISPCWTTSDPYMVGVVTN